MLMMMIIIIMHQAQVAKVPRPGGGDHQVLQRSG